MDPDDGSFVLAMVALHATILRGVEDLSRKADLENDALHKLVIYAVPV